MSVKDLTDDEILKHLKNNTILRNNQLSVLVKLLNSVKGASTLAIDGAWGSGKTVFVKQLQMLADEDVEDYGNNTLDQTAIEELRENQKVFYFNAWENDYVDDALGALLLKLIAEGDEGLTDTMVRKAFKMINPGAYIQNISHDLINIKADIKRDELVKYLKPLVNRHEAINDFIDQIKGDKQRMIFIIDELDRCKPSFAVDLLEVIKHYFIRDDVTFIVATNSSELSHTVKKYYGNDFNGSGYLNKFFDFTMGLQKVDISNYARDVLNWSPNSYVVHQVAHDAIDYLDLQMREINTYHSALRMIEKFLSRNNNWRDEQYPIQFIFVPFALALKLKNNTDFIHFSKGKGADLLRNFLPQTRSGMRYAEKWVKDRANLNEEQVARQAVDSMAEQYKALFTRQNNREYPEDLQDFNDAISLIGSYTSITESGTKE